MPSGAAVGQIAPEGARKKTFRPDIQGLRMVAVVAVILDHLFGWPVGGFVGVDVFFVISGFLITGLLLREHERTGTISFGGFYVRRLKRIMPAAVLVIIVTVACGYLFFNAARATQTFWDGIWATFFAANWRYAALGTDYFNAGTAISPLQHYWSLAVEEQFYFVWPWLMLLIFWMIGRRGSANLRFAHTAVAVAMLLIVAGSFAWALYDTANSPTWAYFSLFTRAWELGIGALLAVVAGSLAALPSMIRPVLGWIGLAGIIVSVFYIDDANGGFPAPWAALPVLSTALVIAAGTGGEQRFLWPLMNPVSSWVGNVSYSLYIWHFPLIIFGISLFGDSPIVLASILVLTFVVAWVSYTLVEDPLRRARWFGRPAGRRKGHREFFPDGLWSRRDAFVSVALVGLIVAGISTAALSTSAPSTPAAAYTPKATFGEEQPAATESSELDALQTEIQASLGATRWPDNLTPSMDDAIAEKQAPEDILPCGSADRDDATCVWGDPDAAHTIVLVGNSVSMTYVEAFRAAVGAGSGWRVISWGRFGCPFTDWAVDDPTEIPEGCAQRHDDAVAAINEIAADVVVVSGIGTVEGTSSQLAKITSGSRILFVPGVSNDKNPQECYTPTSSPADCVSVLPTDWAGREGKLTDFGTLVDTRPWFCTDGQCPPFVGTIPMKMDSAHITHEYADRIAPVIREYLTSSDLGFPAA
ncbi:acyltransferase family protein [Microbacterium sp. cx-59]|uniref:acyltransferase family protein n=1 Tax=Microbacterium sp. cx-59 TaxID=2891207 RepID=UPI001E3BB56A|nr:acyltransferase family protein [Microbacterium sp. cx-59]MCC4908102.1 acyltransferase [Microbacterium sp. cx-59]